MYILITLCHIDTQFFKKINNLFIKMWAESERCTRVMGYVEEKSVRWCFSSTIVHIILGELFA